MHAVQTILVMPRPEAATDSFEIDPEAAVRACTREARNRDRSVAGRGHAVRNHLRECAMDEIDHTLACGNAAIDCGRVSAIEQCTLFRRHMDGPGQTGIRQDGWINNGLHRIIDCGEESGIDHVQTRANLRRADEIKMHLVTLDCNCHRKFELVPQRFRIEHIRKAVGAIRNGSDAGAHLAFGIVHQFATSSENRSCGILVAEFLEARHAKAVRCHLGAQVRHSLMRHLAVQEKQLLDVFLKNALSIEANRGNA